MISISDFPQEKINEAGGIALQLWGDEVAGLPPRLRRLTYQYLARYYFHAGSPLNIAAFDGERMIGFLMALPPGFPEKNEADSWILPQLETDEERALWNNYKAYLDFNAAAERKALAPGEALLLFFTSIQKGTGRLLMQEFEKRCRALHIQSTLLWTDTTCDFGYYEHNRFTAVDHFDSVPLCGHVFKTWLFRKHFGA